jgi:YfiR/HmsC-like
MNRIFIFIGDIKSNTTDEIVKKLNGKPSLIVTERDGLIKKGAGTSFIIMNDKSLKFQLNEQAMNNQGLKISSSLSTLAYKGL